MNRCFFIFKYEVHFYRSEWDKKAYKDINIHMSPSKSFKSKGHDILSHKHSPVTSKSFKYEGHDILSHKHSHVTF